MKKYPLVYLTVIFLGINLCGSFNVYVNDDKEGNTLPKIVLIAGGATVVIGIVLLVFCFCCYKCKKSSHEVPKGCTSSTGMLHQIYGPKPVRSIIGFKERLVNRQSHDQYMKIVPASMVLPPKVHQQSSVELKEHETLRKSMRETRKSKTTKIQLKKEESIKGKVAKTKLEWPKSKECVIEKWVPPQKVPSLSEHIKKTGKNVFGQTEQKEIGQIKWDAFKLEIAKIKMAYPPEHQEQIESPPKQKSRRLKKSGASLPFSLDTNKVAQMDSAKLEKADRFRKMQERYWAQREEKEKLKSTSSLKGAQSNEEAGSGTSSSGPGAAHEESKKDLLDTVISLDRKIPLLTDNKLESVKSQKDYISSLTKLIRQQILSPKGKKL